MPLFLTFIDPIPGIFCRDGVAVLMLIVHPCRGGSIPHYSIEHEELISIYSVQVLAKPQFEPIYVGGHQRAVRRTDLISQQRTVVVPITLCFGVTPSAQGRLEVRRY
jgi:hypothetical protein